MGNKVENLFSSVTALEEDFNSRPDDVAEQRRRDELIRYATIPPFHPVLTSFQEAQCYRGTAAVVVRGVRVALADRSRSRW